MTNRHPEIDRILSRRIATGAPQPPAEDLVPVPEYLLRDGSTAAPQAPSNQGDFAQTAQLLGILFGGNLQQPQQQAQLPPAQGKPRAEAPQIGAGARPGATPPGPSAESGADPSVRERITGFYRTHRLARFAGITALSLLAVTGAWKGFGAVTGETPAQYALTTFNSGKQVLGIGNTYDLVMNSGDCTTPIATIDVESGATMTVRADKALNPDDILKNRKDAKHAVPSEEGLITPVSIKGNPFTGDKTTRERNPEIKFRDTLAVIVCSEGGVNVSGLSAEVDPSKVGFRLISTSVLGKTTPGLEPNQKRVDLYEPVTLGEEPKGAKPIFSDAVRKSINKLMANGENPAITRAFRQNITLKNIEQQCGIDIQAIAKPHIEETVQTQFAQQVSAMKDPAIKSQLEGTKLTLSWKDGESFKPLDLEYIASQKGESYPVPEPITFNNPATKCIVTPLKENK